MRSWHWIPAACQRSCVLGAAVLLGSFAPNLPAQDDPSVTLAWDPSVSADVAGYIVHWGYTSGNYALQTNVGNTTSAKISGLSVGVTNFFVATAYDSYGLESEPSNEVSYTPPEVSSRATPPLTWPTPADVVYGTALGATQLNASSAVPGALAYDPPAGTVLEAGSNQMLSVSFVPADTNRYLSVTATVGINVLRAGLTITAASTNKVYGAPLPALSASYSGLVNGDTPARLTTPVALRTPATAGSPAGTYPITASGAASANYAIAYVDGTLTVDKASTAGMGSSSKNPSRPGEPVGFAIALNAVAPSAGTPGGTVQFSIDGANVGAPVALVGGTATYSTTTLPAGTHAVVANYAGDDNFRGTTNGLSSNQLVNTPPVAGTDIVWRSLTNGANVTIPALLSNDVDADGDPVTFVSVSPSSTQGGNITRSGDGLFYTPPAGFTNEDSFTYTISDGHASVSGTVLVKLKVELLPSPNLVLVALGKGSYLLRFNSVPGATYRVEYSDEVINPRWQTLGSRIADEFGMFEYIDTTASPQRFYRSVSP